jgi:anaerobic magnesium-protoporphyrin IX monomethyl ester cyclase
MRTLLVNYDNQNSAAESWFPQGLAYIASNLRKLQIPVSILDLNVLHDNQTLKTCLDLWEWDVIGLSFIGGYWQYKQFKELIGIINSHKRRNKMYVMVGGHLFAPEPSYFINKFGIDCVVIGDGENIKEVIEKQPRGLYFPKTVDIDAIPWPAYDMFDISHYRLLRMPNCSKTDYCLPVLSSRGCPFRCNFCYRLDKHVRVRHISALIDELKFLIRSYQISYFAFADELLMMSEKRALEVAEALMPLNIKWDCNGRLNFAKPEVLKAMKQAGCVFINYGIEAFDDEVLKKMNKRLDCDTIVKGIEATLAAGISPGLNLIWGNLGDNVETLGKAVDFLLRYDDHAQLRTIRPVTPYPGSQLFDECKKRGLVDDVEDFYERKHTNSDLFTVDLMGIGLEAAYQVLHAANKRLLDRYFQEKQASYSKQLKELYLHRDSTFRGWRQR